MARTNRYQPIIQPTIVNPISFEEFARVPMLKAQVTGEALSATQGIDTQYNVDLKDIPIVDQTLKIVKEGKESLVNNILSEGVNNDTISKFMQVKQLRDKAYKDVIDMAQMNKQKIDKWRATVEGIGLQKGLPAAYIDKVKQVGYDNWQGTLGGKDQTISEFNPYYGPEFFDMDQDIQQALSQAKETTHLGEEDLKGMSYYKDENLGRYIMTDASGKEVSGNALKLKAVADMLMQTYQDNQHKRGQLREFMDIHPQKVANMINAYMAGYTVEDVRRWGGGTSMGGEIKPPVEFPEQTLLTELTKTFIPSGTGTTTNKMMSRLVMASEQADVSGGIKNRPWYITALSAIVPMTGVAYDGIVGWVDSQDRFDEKFQSTDSEFMANNADVVGFLIEEGKKAKPGIDIDYTISPDLYTRFAKGDKDAIEEVMDKTKEYVNDNTSEMSIKDEYYGGEAVVTLDGKKRNDIDPDSKVEEIMTYFHEIEVRDMSNREELDKEEKQAIIDAYNKNSKEVRYNGSLKMGSKLVTDMDGRPLANMSQAYKINYKGKDYLVGRSWEPQQSQDKSVGFHYKHGQEVERHISINPKTNKVRPVGELVPMVLVLGDKQEKVYYKQSGIDGSRRVYFPSTSTMTDANGNPLAGGSVSFDAVSGALYPSE